MKRPMWIVMRVLPGVLTVEGLQCYESFLGLYDTEFGKPKKPEEGPY